MIATNLERLLGLERFKKTRVDWMKEDFKEFFPYRKVYWYTNKTNSISALYISRSDFEEMLPTDPMSTQERLKRAEPGLRLAMFDMWPHPDEKKVLTAFNAAIPFFADAANYDERLLASYLALLCQGQISPRSLPSLLK